MKLITEINENTELLTEGKGKDKKYFVEGIFLQGGIKNRNGREYPVETLMKEVSRYNAQYVKQNRAFGELGHPEGPSINLDRVSHMITSLKKEGNDFVGRAKVMDTPYGRVVKNFIDEGAKLGISSRGMGSIKKEGNRNVVQDDFYLATAGDIVADPSAPSAFLNGIMEGKEWIMESGVLIEKDVEDYKKRINAASRSVSRETEKEMLAVFESFINKL